MKKIIYLVVVLSIVACEIQAARRQFGPIRRSPPPPPRREINIDRSETINRVNAIIDRLLDETIRNHERASLPLTPNSQNQTGGLRIPNNPSSTGINQRPSDSKPGTIPLR